MSALTDLFTALANKIRSKTGGQETYTPNEMVQDGIDDVYEAGVAAGTTTHTQTYTPSPNVAANDMGVTHEYRYVNTSGMITPSGNKAITANGTNIDVSSYATASVAVPDPTLTGDAAVGNVLSGKTFYNDSLTKQTGTMTNRGAWTSTGNNCNASTTKDVTIPAGYHNGSGYVRFNSLSSQTGVDTGKTAVVAGAMLSGYQGWVNGSKISGNISSKAAATYNTSASDQTITSGQYLSGTQTIKAVTTSGITAANIKDGAVVKVGDANSATRIANVTGTFTDAATVSSGQTAAAAAQIKSGYSAWVDGAEVKGTYTEPTLSGDAAVGNVLYGKTFYNNSYTKKTGTMANNGDGSATLNCGESKVLSAGYYSGGTISANSLASQTGVDSGKTAVTAAKMFSGYQGWVNGNKVSGTYVEPTINDITPSSTPIELTDGVIYKAHKRVPSTVSDAAGYAIEAYTSVTPTASGAQFSQGMVKMSDGGYAYSAKPTAALQPTTIWTNSAPTSAFSAQDVTLQNSAKVDDYDFLRFTFRQSSSVSTTYSVVVEVSEFKTHVYGTYPMFLTMAYQSSSSSATKAGRIIAYVSNTQVRIGGVSPINSTTSQSGGYMIPQTIEGLKLVVQ